MTLSVEIGAGSATSESYLSVADFKTYALSNYAVTDTVADDAIEQALRRATRYVDGRYRHRFLGYRTFAFSQALEWPREGVVLNWLPEGATYAYWLGYSAVAGQILANNVIPQMLKDAVSEAAIRELADPGTLTPDRTPARQVLQQTVGPITTVYANVATTRPVVTVIDEILSPLLSKISSYSGSLVRA